MMVRYFALQPIFAAHPLRRLLTTGQDRSDSYRCGALAAS